MHACLVCSAVPRWHVFVCQYFLLSSRSPRVTTLLMDAVNYWESRGRSHWAHRQREWTDGTDEDAINPTMLQIIKYFT